MLTEVCQYLKNWFNRKPNGSDYPKWDGEFTIDNGALDGVELAEDQYFRIMGSLFNDGVHRQGEPLIDETFTGAVWSMGVPPVVETLAEDIETWVDKYGGADSPAMSPYSSESFGGYSYSKQASASGGESAATWQAVFSARLAPWRKI